MSAPRKIWVPMPVTDEGPCYVDKDEAEMQWGCTAVAYHHDDVVRELVEALEFYADRKFTGYEVDISDYGISMSKGEIVLDEGDVARAALAKIAQEG